MARINIYVPKEIKAEMEAADAANWSAIAVAAFREELARRAAVPAILIEAQQWLS